MKQHVTRLWVVAVLAVAGATAVFGFAAPASAVGVSHAAAVVGPAGQDVGSGVDRAREPGTCHSAIAGGWGRAVCTGLRNAKISLYTKCSTGRTVKAVRRPSGSTLDVKVSCHGGRAVRAWTTIKHQL